MSTNNKRRQKQLEKKAAKRKEKRHLQLRKQSTEPLERFASMSKHPVLDCFMSESITEEGIGWVTLCREAPNALVAVASFLLDSYCLGVKNVSTTILNRSTYIHDYRKKLTRSSVPRNISPAEARKLLESAVAYARSIGFEPYPDYDDAMLLFGDVNPQDSNAQFAFGQNGKPHFISGPYDTPSRTQHVIETLTRTCGPGGFHFTIPVSETDRLMLLDEEDQEIDDFDDDVDVEEPEADASEWRRAIGSKDA